MKLQAKYPMLKECMDVKEMVEEIKKYRELEFVNRIRSRYPNIQYQGSNASEIVKELEKYKNSIEYSVTAYFKDKGQAAKKYPGKTVQEIKAIRKHIWEMKKIRGINTYNLKKLHRNETYQCTDKCSHGSH